MICDIQFGKLMIVSDLHGNGFDFRQILKVYRKLKSEGKADYLVFLGDLIHAYPGKRKDESLEIIQELIKMGANKKGSGVICLLGNHEFVHIYHIPLQRGHLEFTSWFENRIRKNREEIVRFFMDMPFMLRTKGGVLVNHTGSSDRYAQTKGIDLNWFKRYSHEGEFVAHIENINTYDPQISSLFMKTAKGDYLWDVLMNGNERQYGEEYLEMVDDLLQFASVDRENSPMTTLVSGHIGVDYGAETIGSRKLRLCSSAGCLRDLEKKYLLIDAEKRYTNSLELLECCCDLY
ncbi:metallophosphoesterase family protein [Labilibaculum sp.]|uniref:metallophosphoesterase family protein n=1 Tax=Labilibaculum sp. TaxID=2060723 RepID=UPI002AA61F7B|nr:metallophosphoesterase family protein [Labilibaculum sp.]MBN2598234.1 metallophosphoesterase [Marinifilaceae bacterium]